MLCRSDALLPISRVDPRRHKLSLYSVKNTEIAHPTGVGQVGIADLADSLSGFELIICNK